MSKKDWSEDFAVRVYESGAMPPDVARDVDDLVRLVWPGGIIHHTARERGLRYQGGGWLPMRQYVVVDGGRVVGLTQTFPWTIAGPEGGIDVLALTAVCTHPEYRGRGLGGALVGLAFQEADRGPYHACIFSSHNERFYGRLGAAMTDAEFIISVRGRTWRWPNVQAYPAGVSWPSGPLRMGGGGW